MKTRSGTSFHGREMLIALVSVFYPVPDAAAAPATVEIDGVIVPGVGVQWTSGGKPAAAVTVNPGDTVVWKAVSGTHGVVFNTQGAAEVVLQFQTGGTLPALGAQTVMGELVWGTAPQPAAGAGTLLAQATVKAGVAPGTNLGFFCSQHGRKMSGALVVSPATPPPPTSNDSPTDPGGLDDPRIKRVVKAQVVAFDHAFMCNRLGTSMPQGMIFALKQDVIPNTGDPTDPIGAGCVTLRPGKRARPIVLRANVGDCLEITFTNLLSASPPRLEPPLERPGTRAAGVHVLGMELIGTINSDASFVGLNLNSQTPSPSGQCAPGETKIYRFFARAEGAFLLYSTAADMGVGLDAGQLTAGLFGSVVVEPAGAEWYRSQVTKRDLELASNPNKTGKYGHPVIDYDAVYPTGTSYEDLAPDGTGVKTPVPAGTPILKMVKPATASNGKPAVEIVHSDLTAIITGPNRGLLPDPGGRAEPCLP